MRVLIVGGTGNISAATTRELVARGAAVTHFNRDRTRSTATIPDGVRTIVGDRTDYPAFEARLRAEEPFDVVIDMIGFTAADAESAIRAFRGRTGQYRFCSTAVIVVTHTAPVGHIQQRLPVV